MNAMTAAATSVNSGAKLKSVEASNVVAAEAETAPDSVDVAEKGKAQRKPRRIIYFQNGDELEEYSTDEEEEQMDQVELEVQRLNQMDWRSMSWGSYLFNVGLFGFLKTFKSLEYAGEVLSYKLGITSPKYYSEMEEAARMDAAEEAERQRAAVEDASWNKSLAKPEGEPVSATPPMAGAAFDGTAVSLNVASSSDLA